MLLTLTHCWTKKNTFFFKLFKKENYSFSLSVFHSLLNGFLYAKKHTIKDEICVEWMEKKTIKFLNNKRKTEWNNKKNECTKNNNKNKTKKTEKNNL